MATRIVTAKTDAADTLKALREPFPLEAVKTRKGSGGKSLDYVAIETVLGRLLDVAPEYNWCTTQVTVLPRVFDVDGEEKVSFTAVVTGQLTIGEKVASGVGAMVNPDPDMAVKSANSEAMKNASKNGFGVMLELWDADYREGLVQRRRMINATEATLKNEVFRIARERLDKPKPTAKNIATLFNTTPSALADEATLREILTAEGVL